MRYSTVERELLGVVWAIDQFRPYVFGREFIVRTDHKPLLWVSGLKETSARITKWKEKLAGYTFRVIHIKGTENNVADTLSRNVNAISQDPSSTEAVPSTSRQIAPQRTSPQPELPPAESALTTLPSQRERSDEPINGKRNQVHFYWGQGQEISCQGHRYGPIRITRVSIGPESSDQEVRDFLKTVMIRGKNYHWWTESEQLLQRVETAWQNSRENQEIRTSVCIKKVETIEDRMEQQDIIKAYHEGKTNHRGIAETINHLQRQYYWLAMQVTVRNFIARCNVCRRSKYARDPVRPKQLHTETPHEVNSIVECDLFTVERLTYLTVVDRLSRLAGAWPLCNKTAESVISALAQHFSVLDTPKQLVMDNGREFNNVKLRQYLESLGVTPYFTTPEHSKSHGTIERVHSTLTEHLILLKEGRKLEGHQAMAAAILAYNSTIHSANAATPFEVYRGQVGAHKVHDMNDREKHHRTEHFNRTRAEDLVNTFQIGDLVYHKNRQRRRKLDPRWKGPFVIDGFLSRSRVRLRRADLQDHKIIVRHVEALQRPSPQHRL